MDSSGSRDDEALHRVRISELLAQGGLSPEQLSETADIPQEELSGILAGSVTPNIDILAKIAKALNTSMDFLIGSVPYSEMISSEERKISYVIIERCQKEESGCSWAL